MSYRVDGSLPFGSTFIRNDVARFRVWAPFARKVAVKILHPAFQSPIPMKPAERGCYEIDVAGISAGMSYFYRIDDEKDRPDPYSRFQPDGVHGPSQIIDPRSFKWSKSRWRGLPLEEFIIYELHIGTFTLEGTFEAVLPHLDYLKNSLGVTAIEIMPVAQFPGERNWGYDGVSLFAPQNSYGGPAGLKRLVDQCHAAGLAVILDVVYNHFGPEGNYLRDFGPYFTERYKTPWGEAINYDDAGSEFVRRYVTDNALYWIAEYEVDALRLDAVHAIYDFSARHILRQMKEAVEALSAKLGRPAYLIAESDLNDPKVIRSADQGGYGLDAQWSDDFHHALHTLLTGERSGYYQDFGGLNQLAKALTDGFVIAGEYSPCRDRIHGASSNGHDPWQFVVFSQNHDQIGNRVLGERLSTLLPPEARKLAAGVFLLSPNLPLLFMGEEYGETAPFQFFTSFQDPALGAAVRKGRQEEAKGFGYEGEVPDPESPETFLRSRIDLSLHQKDPHRPLFTFYRKLIALRKEDPALAPGKGITSVNVRETEKCLIVQRGELVWMLFNFSPEPVGLTTSLPGGSWERRIDSEGKPFGGKGETLPPRLTGNEPTSFDLGPYQMALYRRVG